jgi:hypothetical protein
MRLCWTRAECQRQTDVPDEEVHRRACYFVKEVHAELKGIAVGRSVCGGLRGTCPSSRSKVFEDASSFLAEVLCAEIMRCMFAKRGEVREGARDADHSSAVDGCSARSWELAVPLTLDTPCEWVAIGGFSVAIHAADGRTECAVSDY